MKVVKPNHHNWKLTDRKKLQEGTIRPYPYSRFLKIMDKVSNEQNHGNLSSTVIQVDGQIESEKFATKEENDVGPVDDLPHDDNRSDSEEEDSEIPFSSRLLYFFLGLLGGSCGLVVILCVVCTYKENVPKRKREAFVLGLVVGTLLVTVIVGAIYLKFRGY